MGNALPKSEDKQLWRLYPRLSLPTARRGPTRHFAGRWGGWGKTEQRGREPRQRTEGGRKGTGARAHAAWFKRRHTS